MNINNLVSNFKNKGVSKGIKLSHYTYHSEEVKNKAVELRLSGLKLSEIAKELGIYEGAVQRFCANKLSKEVLSKLKGDTLAARSEDRNADRINRQGKIRIILLSGEKLSNREISIKLGVSNTTINNDMKAINND